MPKDADAATKLKKRTLTNLYNERPAWLANVHKKLDEVVGENAGAEFGTGGAVRYY